MPKLKAETTPKAISTDTIHGKFQGLRAFLNRALYEREEEIDIVLTAMLCGENPLFVGPPGTAKSMMLNYITQVIDNAQRFNILLTKFSVPEEVFGPISMSGLMEDRFARVTRGKLPEAHVAFVDEIFKASSAILNTLLRVLNEREFENDNTTIKCPLVLCLAASNEWGNGPDGGQELGALFDRFLFRKKVSYIKDRANRTKLLGADESPRFLDEDLRFSLEELDEAKQEVSEMAMSTKAIEIMDQILDDLESNGIRPGDRRLYKAARAVQAYAWLVSEEDAAIIEPQHLTILSHILWVEPTEQPEKCRSIVHKLADPHGHNIAEIMLQAADVFKKCSPADATPKLQELKKKLVGMGYTHESEAASKKLEAYIALAFNKVLGR